MNKLKFGVGVLGILCGLASASAFANRTTYFHNNSNYDLRIWTTECYVGQDGKQTCDDEVFGGVVPAHSLQQISISKSRFDKTTWKFAGYLITKAEIDSRLSAGDAKGLITQLPYCNDVHEDNVDGRITLDFVANKVTCANEEITER